MRVDFPTLGKPTRPTVAFPLFRTAYLGPPPPERRRRVSCSSFSRATFALSFPMWCWVALLYGVFWISSSIALIWSSIGIASPERVGPVAKNLSSLRTSGLLESDFVPFRVPERRHAAEVLLPDGADGDAPPRELRDDGVDVPHQELHEPVVARRVGLPFRVECD